MRFNVISASCLTYFRAVAATALQSVVLGGFLVVLIIIFRYLLAFTYRSINFTNFTEGILKFFFLFNAQESSKSINYRLFTVPPLTAALIIGFLYLLFTLTFYFLFAAYLHEQFRLWLRFREQASAPVSLASNCRRWLCDWGCNCRKRHRSNNPYAF